MYLSLFSEGTMEIAQMYIVRLQEHVNSMCTGMAAWEIILKTVATTILLVWVKGFLFKDESELIEVIVFYCSSFVLFV